MLLLFETAAGYAIFKVLDEGKLQHAEDLWTYFSDASTANRIVKLEAFKKFENTTDALAAATALVDSKLSSSLKKFLKKNVKNDNLAVLDAKLGSLIKDKLGITCTYSAPIQELARGIRNQLANLISGLAGQDLVPMSLGLSHSLSRYKLKFSPDKVDTMIVQAIGLLDDLDKELNTYAMRVREWYGWHFPEMAKIVNDNILYAKVVKRMRLRENAVNVTDFSEIPLDGDTEEQLKQAAETSMGTLISELDVANIVALCDQVISLAEYRGQLAEYLKNRMLAISPNLTVLVGELVGARLIAHAGSLINLAKQPGSTIQILGAEKALFRALKTKKETPKYGLLYHAQLVGQTPGKYKGRIARLLASRAALSVRFDALGEDEADDSFGREGRAKVLARLNQFENKEQGGDAAAVRSTLETPKYDSKRQGATPAVITTARQYNPDADVTAAAAPLEEKPKKKKKKREAEEEEGAPSGAEEEQPKKKKKKKDRGEEATPAAEETEEKPKKKKKKEQSVAEEAAPPREGEEKKKKKKQKAAAEGTPAGDAEKTKQKKIKREAEEPPAAAVEETEGKKKKKKKRKDEDD